MKPYTIISNYDIPGGQNESATRVLAIRYVSLREGIFFVYILRVCQDPGWNNLLRLMKGTPKNTLHYALWVSSV